jgi:hypothetical protein
VIAMRVSTFYDEYPDVDGMLVKVSGTSCIVEFPGGHRVMRHVSRVTPLDDEARKLLEGADAK